VKRNFEWHGHRGCRGLLPENSIPAFLRAVEIGVDSIEMDVVISRDKKVVVAHEPWMPAAICRKPNGAKILEVNERAHNLYRMKYREIKQYNCGIRDPRFPEQEEMQVHRPLLSEVIEQVESFTKFKGLPPVDYSVELKCEKETDKVFHPNAKKFARKVVKVLKKYGIEERTLIQSFDRRVLRRLNRKHPAIHCSYLKDRTPTDLEAELRGLGFIPSILGLRHDQVTEEVVRICEKNGMKVIPWTVNEIDDMVAVLKKGAHGIITDYPNRLGELLARLEKE